MEFNQSMVKEFQCRDNIWTKALLQIVSWGIQVGQILGNTQVPTGLFPLSIEEYKPCLSLFQCLACQTIGLFWQHHSSRSTLTICVAVGRETHVRAITRRHVHCDA